MKKQLTFILLITCVCSVPVNLALATGSAPTATNMSAAETYTEDTPKSITDIVVTDVDSTTITATLTLSNTSAGTLSTGTSGAVTSTFSGGVWTASGPIANVNSLLASVFFTPAADFNSNFTITTSITDDTSNQITGSKAFTGTPVNDPPTATNLSAAETYTEDTPKNLTDIVAADVDGGTITVTLTLSNTSAGTLSTGTSGAVTSTFSGGVWTAAGAISDVNTLLAGVIFTPTLNFNSNFSIVTSVSDGVAPAITGTKAFTGIPVDDPESASAETGCGTLYQYESGYKYAVRCGVKTLIGPDTDTVVFVPVPVTPNNPVFVSSPVATSSVSVVSTQTPVVKNNFNTDLKSGMSGEEVLKLQQFLQSKNYLTVTPNGYFGQATKAAVILFQKAHQITPAIGFFGPVTRGVANNLI